MSWMATTMSPILSELVPSAFTASTVPVTIVSISSITAIIRAMVSSPLLVALLVLPARSAIFWQLSAMLLLTPAISPTALETECDWCEACSVPWAIMVEVLLRSLEAALR